MMKQECEGWQGGALVARLPGRRRPTDGGRRGRSSTSELQKVSRLVLLKRYVQARLNEVARVLRMPPPDLRLDHHGNASIGTRRIPLDLAWVDDVRQQSSSAGVCALTLLRASLAAFFEPLLPEASLRRLVPATLQRLGRFTDFLAGYVLAAFRATFETRRAFLREVAPLPDDQSPDYHERLFAFEQGQLAFRELVPA